MNEFEHMYHAIGNLLALICERHRLAHMLRRARGWREQHYSRIYLHIDTFSSCHVTTTNLVYRQTHQRKFDQQLKRCSLIEMRAAYFDFDFDLPAPFDDVPTALPALPFTRCFLASGSPTSISGFRQ
jgi:hypothetical protein